MLGSQISRRRALSTAGKGAIGAAAVVVIGGVAYALNNQSSASVAPTTVTQTVDKTTTVTGGKEVVTATKTQIVEQTALEEVTQEVTQVEVREKTTTVEARDYYYDPSLAGTEITVGVYEGPATWEMRQFYPLFTEETGIKVNFITQDFGTLRERYIADMVANTGKFDVVQTGFGGAGAAELRRGDWVSDLTPYVNKTPSYEYTDHVKVNRNQMEIGSGIFGIMQEQAYHFFGWRKDLLEAEGLEGPKDWNEFRDVGAKFYKPEEDMYGVSIPGVRDPGLFAEWWSIFKDPAVAGGDGGHLWGEDYEPTVVKSGGIAASKLYQEIQDLCAPGHATRGQPEAWAEFYAGKSALFFPGSTIGWAWENPEKSKVVGKVAIGKPPVLFAIGVGLAINNDSKHKDAAWSFISWITSKTAMQRYALKGNVPTRLSQAKFAQPEELQQTIGWVSTYGKNWPRVAIGIPIFIAFADPVSQMLAGDIGPKEAMELFDTKIYDLFEQAGYYSNPPDEFIPD
jgi:ABC-type glycerol-3-phosphate transport system substrate-binding protein